MCVVFVGGFCFFFLLPLCPSCRSRRLGWKSGAWQMQIPDLFNFFFFFFFSFIPGILRGKSGRVVRSGGTAPSLGDFVGFCHPGNVFGKRNQGDANSRFFGDHGIVLGVWNLGPFPLVFHPQKLWARDTKWQSLSSSGEGAGEIWEFPGWNGKSGRAAPREPLG